VRIPTGLRHRAAARAAAVAVAAGTFGGLVAGVAPATATATGAPRVAAPDAAAGRVLAAARAHVGDAYVYGGTGPTRWDCSGLTSVMWRTAGGVPAIPRVAKDQQAWATPVSASQAAPGDLVFFGRPAYHVGLYEGQGWILDASSSRGAVVERPLWTTDVTYGRVPRATAPAVAGTTTPPVPAGSRQAAALVRAAKNAVGARYARGGTGPAYDDGALVSVLWKRITGVALPTDRTALARRTAPVSRSALRAGDVVVYGGATVWHVGIYVGDGRMVDASRSQGHVVLRALLVSGDLRYGRLPRS
jgi:cell wall-associated NlpC family hydrolase